MSNASPAGSRRFLATVFCFALVNAGAWIAYDRWRIARTPLLEITQFAPDDQATVQGKPRFWWTFNMDVAPTKPTEAPGVTLPQIAGVWEWSNARTLNFTPSNPLPKANTFHVSLLPERIHSVEGFPLKKPSVVTVVTPGLQIESVRQAEFDDRGRIVGEITFNDDVVPSDVLSHLTVTDSHGKPVHVSLHGDAQGHIVRFITSELPYIRTTADAENYVRVLITPGLAGRGGPRPLTNEFAQNVTLESHLAATEARCYFSDHAPVLALRFNNPIDVGVLKPLVSIDPPVPFTITTDYEGISLHGDFAAATRYAIKIAQAPAGTPRAASPRPDTLSVFVSDRPPSFWFEHEQGYLGSQGTRTIAAHAVNVPGLKVSATRIYDNNLVAWRTSGGSRDSDDLSRPVGSHVYRLPGRKNQTNDLGVSLDDILPAGAPHDGVYQLTLDTTVQTTDDSIDDDGPVSHRGYRQRSTAVVTLSDIGLSAKRGRTTLTVWATSLKTTEPQAGVRVRAFSSKNQPIGEAVTDADGLATIHPSVLPEGEEVAVILADRVDQPAHRDLTWLDLRASRLDLAPTDVAGAKYLRSGFEAFAYTDRGVYRPGETVHLRAIVRGPDGATPPAFPIAWMFRRPDLHDWRMIAGTIDVDGATSLDLPLPEDLPTGRWTAMVGLPGEKDPAHAFGTVTFQVEDFMPSRMQLSLRVGDAQSASRMSLAETIPAKLQADYLFGRPVSDRPAHLIARVDPTAFKPAQWDGYTFGDAAETVAKKLEGHRVELDDQTTDANGAAAFEITRDELFKDVVKRAARRSHQKLDKTPPASSASTPVTGAWRLSVTASVTETGGRAVSASRSIDVDAVDSYVGVRTRNSAPTPNEALTFDVVRVSPDGTLQGGDVDLEASLLRENWNESLVYEKGRYVYQSTRLLEPVQQRTVTTAAGKASVDFGMCAPGAYVLRVTDPSLNAVTSLALYVGDGSWDDNISRERPESLDLIVRAAPDSNVFFNSLAARDVRGAFTGLMNLMTPPTSDKLIAGRPAQVIVRSPFAGRLLLSVESDDVVRTRVIEMPASHCALTIDLGNDCKPNAYITATVIRAVESDAPWHTHRAFGATRVRLDQSDRHLVVKVAAPKEIRPATTLDAAIVVTDSNGMSVANSAVTVTAVDEGICQLTNFQTPDPFAFFTRDRALGVEWADLYSDLMPEALKPDKISEIGGDKSVYDPRHASPVSARRVKPVALVSKVLHTDARGIATTSFQVPQFNGKLRLMAVASALAATGSSDSNTLVRAPVLVQSSWPRFAAPGDSFRVPMTVFNNTDAPASIALSVHAADGPLRFGDARNADVPQIVLPPHGQVTEYVNAQAEKSVGVSHISVIATSNGESSVEDIELPIRPASPEITRGGFASATPDKPILVSIANDMLGGAGRLKLNVTQKPTLQLPQGLDYLERYPYGCLEQTTSTLFPLVYLSDIGKQIAPGVFEESRVANKVQVGITRLIGMQTASGGLSMWPGYREVWPWGSVYAAHFLVEAEKAGHPVPPEFRHSLLAYVRNLLNQSSDEADDLTTQSYACYVLALAGTPDRPAMNRLAELVKKPRPDGHPSADEARFHLAAAWLQAGRRDLASALLPQELPTITPHRSFGGAIGSDIRDRAVMVNTLLAVQPDDPALPQLVQQLADAGLKKRWLSTQDTAFAVLAIGRYLRQAQADTPYASAEISVDGKSVVKADGDSLNWDGRLSKGQQTTEVKVAVGGDANSHGYLTWLLTGVPLQPPAPADHGLTVKRQLFNESGEPLDQTQLHSGDLIRVELSISSPTPLQNLVVEDLLPAGLEIENPHLANTAEVRDDEHPERGNPFADSRVDMRDDRLVVMGNLTRAGEGHFSYTARAVTGGTFVLPPVRGECMYDLSTNSISSSGTIVVQPIASTRVANLETGN